MNPNDPNRRRDPRLTAARCGKSKPRPGTPFIGAKLGLSGVATGGKKPRLELLPRPAPENPRTGFEKLRGGAEDPRMGAEEPRRWAEADTATPKLSAITNPSLYIAFAIDQSRNLLIEKMFAGAAWLQAGQRDFHGQRNSPFVRFYAIRIPVRSRESSSKDAASDTGPESNQREEKYENPSSFCPVCSARLEAHKCKLRCLTCGYYMSCSDYY